MVGAVNVDEVDFGLVARVLHAGGLLYRDVVDNKPPLTYLAFWPAGWPATWTLLPMWPVGVGVALATCLVLRWATARWTLSVEAGWLAAWCAVLAMLCEVPSVNAELLMNLPASLALAAVVAARTGNAPVRLALAAGLAVGTASLFKQQALFLVPALGVGLVWPDSVRPARVASAIARLFLLVLGAALPWLVCVVFFTSRGTLREFLDWVVVSNLTYLGRAPGPVLSRLWPALAAAVGVPLLLWLLALRGLQGRLDGVRAMLSVALLSTWVPVCLGSRFYEHYFLQFAPPLAMLAAPSAAQLASRWGGLSRPLRLAVLFLAVAPPMGYLAYTWGRAWAGAYPTQDVKLRTLAGWLREHTQPSDRLFVWGDYAPVYWLAERLPGTRYIMTAVHAGNFDPAHLPEGFDVRPFRSDADVRRTLEDLERRRPAWVVDTAPADIHHWSHVPLSAFPELQNYIHDTYTLVARPAGADVYRASSNP
jgi:hypothetical protein